MPAQKLCDKWPAHAKPRPAKASPTPNSRPRWATYRFFGPLWSPDRPKVSIAYLYCRTISLPALGQHDESRNVPQPMRFFLSVAISRSKSTTLSLFDFHALKTAVERAKTPPPFLRSLMRWRMVTMSLKRSPSQTKLRVYFCSHAKLIGCGVFEIISE